MPTPVPAVGERVISGGANQLVAYRPNLEAEGEIAIIEKILAMRTVQNEEVSLQNEEVSFFLKGFTLAHYSQNL